jgi:uncharacterized repeat protein (TIGR01451 family)
LNYHFNQTKSGLILSTLVLGFLSIAVAHAQQAQPVFTQEFQPDTIAPGSHSYLVFTIDNNAGMPVSNATFTNTLPASVTLGEYQENTCGGTVTAPAGGTTINLIDGEINTGQTCSLTVSVTSSTVGTHINTSGDLTSSAGNSGTSTDDLIVATDRPGFSKSFSPNTIDLGESSTLTFTIDNSANASIAANLTFSDQLPVGLDFDEPANITNTCGGSVDIDRNNRTISSPFDGLVAAGDTCTINVDVIGIGLGELLNSSGDLSSQFSFPANNSGHAEASITVNGGDLVLQKQFIDDPVAPGGTVQLRYQIDNFDRFDGVTNISFTDNMNAVAGGLTATNTPISNACGAGSTVSFSGGVISLFNGSLPAEGGCDFTVTLQVPVSTSPGIYPSNSSSVGYTRNGSTQTGNQAAANLVVSAAPLLSKQFLQSGTLSPGPVVAGGDVVLRFTLTNTSQTSALSNGTFIDELTTFLPFPINATLPPTPNPPCGAGSSLSLISLGSEQQGLMLTGGSLAAAESCTFDVTLTIPLGLSSGFYDNITEPVEATVDGENVTGNAATDQLEVVAAPEFSKEFIDDPVQAGDTVTLEFEISHGLEEPSAATGISFTDDLDATLSGLVAIGLPLNNVCGAGSQISGTSTLTFSGGQLAPGETCTIQVTLQVPAGAASGTYANTTSDLSATVNGLAVQNLPASDDLRVSPVDFTLNLVPDRFAEGVGGTMALEFTIDNLSAGPLSAISFTADLNGALSGLSATGLPVPGFCGPGSSITGTTFLTMTGGDLAAGASCTFSVNTTIPIGAGLGGYSIITSTLSDSSGVISGPASDDFSVEPAILFSKNFLTQSVAPGATIDLEFVIENNSDIDGLTGITFSDDLDAALSGLTAVGLPLNNACGAGSSVTGTSVITLSGGTIPASGNCTFTVTVQTPAATPGGTQVLNTTSTITGTMNGQPVNGAPAIDDFSIFALQFSKAFSGLATAGGTVDLTFNITNLDASLAQSDINFTDDLNAMLPGATAVGLPMADVCGAGSLISGSGIIQLTGGSLTAGGSCQFTVTVSIPASATAGTYPNTTSPVFVRSDEAGTAATDNLGIEPPPTFDKAFTVNAVLLGEVFGLSFGIDNSAAALSATGLNFVDNMPAGLVVAGTPNISNSCGGSVTANAGGGSIVFTGGSVSAGTSCSLSVDVVANTAGNLINTTGDLTSSSGNSGPASASVDVLSPLSITKSFNVGSAMPGDVVVMNLSITNNNVTDTASAMTLSDDLDAFIPGAVATNTPQNDACGLGSTLTGTSIITLNNGVLAAGESCLMTVNVQLPSNQFGQFTNTTSPLNYVLNGSAVTGEPASAGSADLVITGAPEAVAVSVMTWPAWLLLMGLIVVLARKRKEI